MKIDLNQIKELRSLTGAGVVDAKDALGEANGDIKAAINVLRKQGKATAAKKSDRTTGEGVVASYIHSNNKIAVIVSLLCETDFVARNEKFQQLAKDIALHIAATDPLVVNPEDVPEDEVANERKLALELAESEGKPKDIQEKIVAGKLKKFSEERALMTQAFVKDPDKTIADLVHAAVSELGENISIKDFSRISI